MHPLILVGTLALGSVASAATNCNPTFSAPFSGDCITNCNKKAGTGLYKDWTNDPASPKFIESLSYQCAKGTTTYTAFMTDAGICMMGCSKDEQTAFGKEFQVACQWYSDHKDDKCDGSAASGNGNAGANSGNGNAGANSGNGNAGASGSNSAAAQKPQNSSNKVQLGAWSAMMAAAVGYIVFN
ncbi:hypothetical protein DFQ28_002728 [Apophysomyces sp. BC1034]|nr:hypothetical protein DFQ30_005562 [Apophysomyces sp. BC1015]KAG0179514.1 hypothetical protein DFQ29_002021 [Apophysomyces sp. BC1021]KAG0189907.1 hypothetical protein DFQ28_002728 [Apophysomyces sp. BC1034]